MNEFDIYNQQVNDRLRSANNQPPATNQSDRMGWFNDFLGTAGDSTAKILGALRGTLPGVTYNTQQGGGAPGAGAAAGSSNTMLWVGIIVIVLVIGVAAVVVSRK